MERKGRRGGLNPPFLLPDRKFYDRFHYRRSRASRDREGILIQARDEQIIPSQGDMSLCMTYQLTVTLPSCEQA